MAVDESIYKGLAAGGLAGLVKIIPYSNDSIGFTAPITAGLAAHGVSELKAGRKYEGIRSLTAGAIVYSGEFFYDLMVRRESIDRPEIIGSAIAMGLAGFLALILSSGKQETRR